MHEIRGVPFQAAAVNIAASRDRYSASLAQRLKALTRNTAICPRVTESFGQYRRGSWLQPDVIPSARNRSMKFAAKFFERGRIIRRMPASSSAIGIGTAE